VHDYYTQTDPSLDIGGRILGSVVRPYAAKVAGLLVRCEWEVLGGVLEVEWVVPPSRQGGEGEPKTSGGGEERGLRTRETEIFFPDYLSRGRKVLLEGEGFEEGSESGEGGGVRGGRWRYDRGLQTVFVLNPLPASSEGGSGAGAGRGDGRGAKGGKKGGKKEQVIKIRISLDPPLSTRWNVSPRPRTRRRRVWGWGILGLGGVSWTTILILCSIFVGVLGVVWMQLGMGGGMGSIGGKDGVMCGEEVVEGMDY